MSSSVSTPSGLLSNQTSLSHLIALPSALLPLSPAVSALHLARIRLLASIPSAATSSSAATYNPNLSTISCSRCGALSVPGLTASLDIGRSRVRRQGTKPRAYSVDRALPDNENHLVSSRPTKGPQGCQSRKKGWNRLRRECLLCGWVEVEKGSDRNVLSTFPSARRTRGMAKAEEQVAASASLQMVVDTRISPIPSAAIVTVNSPNQESRKRPALLPQPSSVSLTSTPTASAAPSPRSTFPSALLSPALAHVPSSHPTPPALPPPQTPSSLGSVSSGDLGGSKEKRKKAKKSGLQKMLAASKEKQGEEKKGGSSLLDWMGELG